MYIYEMDSINLVMDGSELRGLRQRLEVSQAKLAALVGVHTNTLARYERDEITIPEPVARLVRMLAEKAEKKARRKRRS